MRFPRHLRSALLALFALTCVCTAEDPNVSAGLPTYHSTVSEVRVTFFATDENNLPVSTLTKSDFAVIDNEHVVRNFRSFAHSAETSLDVVALIDLSESVAPRIRGAIRDLRQLIAREQTISDDNIAVLSFGGTFGAAVEKVSGARPAILCSAGCRDSDFAAKLLATESSGATPLFDALVFGADFIAHHRDAGRVAEVRPVLILFSDGNDTISLHSPREALDALLAVGALIYTVDMGKSENQTSGGTFLRQVSAASGGRYFDLSSSRQNTTATVLNAVLDDLRASYVVTYDLPSHRDGIHSLRLLPTRNLNLTFHSRTSYEYEPGGP